ncbi:MAG TPA: bifunctional nuclease domain-containing protein [archaeon]|nr:bifunctional nuclease domain-containing protein [archaeon]
MRKKKYPNELFLLLIVIAAIGAVALSNAFDYNPMEYVKADKIQIVDSNVVIGNGCTAIIATTTPERAKAIQLGIDGTIEDRPTIYDSTLSMMKTYNITVEKLLLNRKDETFYYSDLYLTDGLKNLKLDILPSDGIALALRAEADVMVNKTLLEEEGENIC